MPVPNITLDDLAAELGIARWDAILVGDGSGTTWDSAFGWASVLVDARTRAEKRFAGCASAGTNHTAELRAYLEPMLWYTQTIGKEALKQKMHTVGAAPCLAVHVIADSEVVAKQGNGAMARNANRALWAAMDSFAGEGYALTWHWAGRNRLAENRWADREAGRMRLMLSRLESEVALACARE